jgi:hypothetical protein
MTKPVCVIKLMPNDMLMNGANATADATFTKSLDNKK